MWLIDVMRKSEEEEKGGGIIGKNPERTTAVSCALPGLNYCVG